MTNFNPQRSDSIPNRGRKGISFSPPHPDRHWSPLSLLYNVCRRLFPWGQSDRGVNLTSYLHSVPSLRMRGAISPFPNMSSWCGTLII